MQDENQRKRYDGTTKKKKKHRKEKGTTEELLEKESDNVLRKHSIFL